MLKFYNTLTRKKEIFKPLKKNEVRIYSCGPTVYNLAHIGNFRSYIFTDLLHRYLIYKGYKVKNVMNITDIDDKTIRESIREGITLKNFTQKYIKEFFKDLETLNIKKISYYPKATDYISEMIKFTEVLEKKGYAYEKLHSVYFDISKFKNYGKLSRIKLKGLKAGSRVDLDEYEKEAPGDFTLLKRSTLEELKKGIFYETKWGKIRPGWHLECSVMSMKYLGKIFDIHTGGVDLIFPHHENEIAQSEALTGQKFVNYWLHNEHLLINGKKMSKSLGNYYTLRDLLKKNYSWQVIRFFLLSTHYRTKINLTFKGLDGAEKSIERLKDFIKNLKLLQNSNSQKRFKEIKSLLNKVQKEFEKALDDDLKIPKALAVIFNFIKEINKIKELNKKMIQEILVLVKKFDSVLGLNLLEDKIKIPKEVLKLVEKREKLRNSKQWQEADKIRDKIQKLGYKIEDTSKGPFLTKFF